MAPVHRFRGMEVSAQHRLLDELGRLCRDEPLSAHCYATYYLVHEPRSTEVLLLSSRGDVESYALVWRGGRFSIQDIYEIHMWNPSREVLAQIRLIPDKRCDIQLYGDPSIDVEEIIDHFRRLGFKRFSIEEFYDMVCSRSSFTPSPLENLAVVLGEEHAALYRDLELERGIEITLDEAREILRTYRHYGVITEGTLASIAARYATLPWIHVVGGVFTRRRYRRRGFAKAVVSAITREAVDTGAVAGLHVEVGNEPAVELYRSLGYRILRTRTWIFAHP